GHMACPAFSGRVGDRREESGPPIYCPADRFASSIRDQAYSVSMPASPIRRAQLLNRRRFLRYSALAPAAMHPLLLAKSSSQGPGGDLDAPHISPRALEIHRRAFIFDAHVHALDREFYHGGSMGDRKTDG